MGSGRGWPHESRQDCGYHVRVGPDAEWPSSLRADPNRRACQTPLSFGLATASFSGAVIGKFRFTFFGGIGRVNHFA
ncbi:hypothetical protein ACVWY2_006295 [Bradyrhizobium sp. JR6.1]